MIYKQKIFDREVDKNDFDSSDLDNLLSILRYKAKDIDLESNIRDQLVKLNLFSRADEKLSLLGYEDIFIGCVIFDKEEDRLFDFQLQCSNFYHFFEDLKSFKAYVYDLKGEENINIDNDFCLDRYTKVVSYTSDKEYFFSDDYFHYVTLNRTLRDSYHPNFIYEDSHDRDNINFCQVENKLYIEDQLLYDLLNEDQLKTYDKEKSILGTNHISSCLDVKDWEDEDHYQKIKAIRDEYDKHIIILVSEDEDKYLVIYPHNTMTMHGKYSYFYTIFTTLVKLFKE